MNIIMRYLTYIITTCSFILLLGVVGCEDYLNINEDPNNPTEAPAAGLITSATYETSLNVFRAGDVTSFFVQYLGSPNPGSSTDTHEPVSYNGLWFNIYDVLTDLNDLEELAEEEGATEYVGLAKVMKAINLGLLVDLWGNVPYSDAFNAEETITPSYDSDEQLYNEVFTLLNDGITALQESESSITTGDEDFIYEGDIDQWIKTAYLLRARYLNHLSETASYDPTAVLDAIDNAYTGNEDDAQLENFNNNNPWAEIAIDNAGLILGGWMSEQIVNHMNGNTYGVFDPRIETFMSTNDDDEYVGVRNGAGRGDAPPSGAFSVLTTDTYYADENAPLLVATYAEQKFIEAEAAFRDNQTSRAYQAYLDGIEAHMDKVGVSEADKNDYMNEPTVAVGEGSLTLDDIMREKYVVMFLHPEAWVDARRYDYQYEGMEIPANHNPSLNGEFIRRLAYPDSETQRNSGNVPDVSLTDRIFWDE